MKALVLAGALALGLAVAVAPAASAAVDLDGGTTTVTLGKQLAHAGVTVSATGKATRSGRRVRFPITGGAIDPPTAGGRIDHGGGLRLAAGGHRVTLGALRVSVGAGIRLSAAIGAKRVTVAELTGRPKLSRHGFDTRLAGLTLRLTRAGAAALDARLGPHAVAEGAKLGTLSLDAHPSQTELAPTGTTALTLDPGALATLAGLGIAPGASSPATLAETTVSFPVAGGKAQLDLRGGTIAHTGGLTLTAGTQAVRLETLSIRLGASPQLLATVNGSPGEVPIADLTLPPAPAVAGRTITLTGVTVRLAATAAFALGTVFGPGAFPPGMLLGTATVTATGR